MSREQGAVSRERRAGSRQQGLIRRGHGAEGHQQGAGSRERSTESEASAGRMVRGSRPAIALLQNYGFIDYVTQGYIALVGLMILFLHGGSVRHWPWLFLAHTACLLVNHALIQSHARRPQNRTLEFLRHFYPVLLYTGFYRETGALNQMVSTGYLDPFFIRGEEFIFGCQPSLAFMETLPYLPLSELLYASYFSYYIMIAGVGLALFLRNRTQFFHYISLVSFVFYVCYFTYILLPVMGPRVFYKDLAGYELPADLDPGVVPSIPAAIRSGPFFQIMAFIYRHFEAPGAAFPSSHVAIALVTLYFSFLYLRRIRHLHAVVVSLLCVSTVYCRYHYVVDVVAGALTAALLIPLGNRLYHKFRAAHPPPT